MARTISLCPAEKGSKVPGKKATGRGSGKVSSVPPHLAGDDEAVQVVQHGGVVVEGEGVPGRLVQEAQELFPGTNQAVPPHLLGNGGVAEDVLRHSTVRAVWWMVGS